MSVNTQPQREQKLFLLSTEAALIISLYIKDQYALDHNVFLDKKKKKKISFLSRIWFVLESVSCWQITRCRSASGWTVFFKLSVLSSCSFFLFCVYFIFFYQMYVFRCLEFFSSHFNYLNMEQILWSQTPVVSIKGLVTDDFTSELFFFFFKDILEL